MPARTRKPVGTPSTSRSRPVECSEGCGTLAYMSRAQMSRGLMSCHCGGLMWPRELEDAFSVLAPDVLETHPLVIEYRRECASVMHGQAGPGRSMRSSSKTFRAPEMIAAERLEARRREIARETRLGALRVYQLSRTATADASAEIPF